MPDHIRFGPVLIKLRLVRFGTTHDIPLRWRVLSQPRLQGRTDIEVEQDFHAGRPLLARHPRKNPRLGIDVWPRQRLFDAQAFVPLGHALGTREAANLELRHAPTDSEMHDAYILRLP